MQAWRIDPEDQAALAEFHEVWHASDADDWPELAGFGLNALRAFATHTGTTRSFQLYAAGDPRGPMMGTSLMELPLRDNLHSAEITVNVHPAHRRRGVGSALVELMAERAGVHGRRVLNSLVDVPLAKSSSHPSTPFAKHAGFEPTLAGNMRHLVLPMDTERIVELRHIVEQAKDAEQYRTFTFQTPWPKEYTEDRCELGRRMSTDEPPGDSEHEEED